MATYSPVDNSLYSAYDRDLDANISFIGAEVISIEWDDMEIGGHPSASPYFMIEIQGDDMPYTLWVADGMPENTRNALTNYAESVYNTLE